MAPRRGGPADRRPRPPEHGRGPGDSRPYSSARMGSLPVRATVGKIGRLEFASGGRREVVGSAEGVLIFVRYSWQPLSRSYPFALHFLILQLRRHRIK